MPPAGQNEFGLLNTITLLIYFAAMLAVGWWAGRRVKSSRGYFVAEGRLGSFVVGLSLLGTYLSALTMMALPGKAFGPDDLTFTVQLPFLVLTALVITRYVLPHYRQAGVVSVYQYLELRLHLVTRLLASLSFIVFSIARMGLVLYLPALAISQVTSLSLSGAILLMGVVTTLYTVIGGIEAVIWTEAAQVLVFVAAALASIAFILAGDSGHQFMAIAGDPAAHKFRFWVPGASIWKLTSLWLILETIFSTIRIYGTQQDMTQRYAATTSTREANRSVWISILGYIPLGYLFYFMGTALFVYYKLHPDPLLPTKADAVYPFFVVTRLPQGVAGLVIAGIFAAAMSSISSLMNSSSTVCVEDFIKRFGRPREDRSYLALAKGLTLVWGILHIVMAFQLVHTKSALDVWLKIMALSTNGVLGLMVLAFLPRRVQTAAAVFGFVGSYAVLLYLVFGTKVTFLVWTVSGNLSCLVLAALAQGLLSLIGRPMQTREQVVAEPGPADAT